VQCVFRLAHAIGKQDQEVARLELNAGLRIARRAEQADGRPIRGARQQKRLGYCYSNWGLLLRQTGDRAGDRDRLQAALDIFIFTELKMPRQRDAVKAALEKT
jgi:hypothetical protein